MEFADYNVTAKINALSFAKDLPFADRHTARLALGTWDATSRSPASTGKPTNLLQLWKAKVDHEIVLPPDAHGDDFEDDDDVETGGEGTHTDAMSDNAYWKEKKTSSRRRRRRRQGWGDPENESTEHATVAAEKTAQAEFKGDVNDLLFIDPYKLVTASSTGTLQIWNTLSEEQNDELECLANYSAHRFDSISYGSSAPRAASCNAVTSTLAGTPEVATCGEDGRLVVYRPDVGQVSEDIEIDAMSLNDIEWVGAHVLALASSSGQLHLVDRRDCRKPAMTLTDRESYGGVSLLCVSANRNQTNKIATGDFLGRVVVWDIKNAQTDTEERWGFENHRGAVWDLKFHPNDPTTLLSCGHDSRVCVRSWSDATANGPWQQRPRASDRPGSRYATSPGAAATPSSTSTAPTTSRHLEALQMRLSMNALDVHGPSGLLAVGSDSGKLLMQVL